ncbi:glycoside hydrolase family 18 protein [Piscinibacter terrae]|uniref:chitinase n=1 Tax=Piscinibacter terrae TaxID=2496871 RepID=A0A3N7HR93_9BURK|nr:glycoside hydrolase family 18 protein [Albitalea terrae]RQP24760.1 chitinase [Albitalea terrae]
MMTSWKALALAALTLGCASGQAAPAPKGKLLIAYYLATTKPAERYVSPDSLPGRKLTHLNYAFANIAGGEIAIGNPSVDTDNFARLRTLKKKSPGLKTLISVGGWEWSGQFSDVALTAESRAKFAASGVAFIRKHGFDGVDVDWEFPVAGGMESNVHRPEDKQNFTLLMQALREALDQAGREDKRHYLLTAAVGNNDSYLRNTEPEAIGRALDWLNVMTYDMNGPWSARSGHVAPLYPDPAISGPGLDPRNNVSEVIGQYLAAGVPAGKIVMGVPFYAYSWRGCAAALDGQYQSCGGKGPGTWEEGALDYADLVKNYVGRNGYEVHWNEAAKVPYLYKAGTGEFVTYDDPRSLREKLRFLKAKGLAGAMFWQITGDHRDALLNALAAGLRPGGK